MVFLRPETKQKCLSMFTGMCVDHEKPTLHHKQFRGAKNNGAGPRMINQGAQNTAAEPQQQVYAMWQVF